MLYWRRKYGQSLLEFILLIIFIAGAFLVFQKYIVRSFVGRWKAVGDSLGQGRIYDPERTLECAFDETYTFKWYDVKCFEAECEDDCYAVTGSDDLCYNCIDRCTPLANAVPGCSD